jgi:holo-[acyl-carrier protein] synthase
MIIGNGIDIVKIKRVENLYEKFGDKFLKRVFTEGEIEYCKKKKLMFNGLALRFAAKESLLKSIKTGLRDNLKLSEIEVVNNDLGAPSLTLHGEVKKYLDSLNVKKTHLSLSDDGEYAIANVILEG